MDCGLRARCVAGLDDRCCVQGIEAGGSLNVPDGDVGRTRGRDSHGGGEDEAELSQDKSENDRHGHGNVCCGSVEGRVV
jgi:hypothetical protein